MAETYTGEVRNGVVVFEGTSSPLPSGTKVRIEPIGVEATATLIEAERSTPLLGGVQGLPAEPAEKIGLTQNPVATGPMASTRAWLLAAAKEAEANAPPLPPDLAENHDHYAHGRPLR